MEMGILMIILKSSREQTENYHNSLIQIVSNECDNQIRDNFRTLNLLALDDGV